MTIQQLNSMKLKIKGFTKLQQEEKVMFKKFIFNYLNQYEENIDQHIPTQVSKRQGYLRVQFPDYWLHVTNSNTWY